VAALVNGTGAVRKAAAEALRKVDPDWGGAADSTEALPALVARLKQDGPVAAEAADALALIGPAATPVLVGALTSEAGAVRAAAATTLGRIGPAARCAASALTAALRDPHDRVREAAALALAKVAAGEEVR